ncbi:MAG: YCF48-related protein [Actinomycetota bacterium]|nr:YCF48-related protein [Actinomycetota bacterium]
MTVLGTSDGGAGWWTSAPLPGTGTGCCSSLSYQVGFTDASHGWLYGMQWEVQGEEVWQIAEQLWQTSDGGRTWTVVPGRLPLQGAIDSADETCPNEPPFAVVFANQQDGWLTASSCSAIGSGPQIWRTTDGGATWTATALPTPGAGWPSATSQPSGVVVGSPWIVGSDLLVAVAGPSGLTVEASADGGQTWQVAGPAVPGTSQYAKLGGFQPVSGADWFVSVPGAVVQTTDAGQTWHTVSTPTLLPGGPISFSGPDQATRGCAPVSSPRPATEATPGALAPLRRSGPPVLVLRWSITKNAAGGTRVRAEGVVAGLRRHLAVPAAAAAVVAAALVLLVTGLVPGLGLTGSTGPAAGSAGSDLYATQAGVVWSFTPGHLGQVARSANGGRSWQVVLPGGGPHTGLALSASYFLGPDLGWVVHQYSRSTSSGGTRVITTVLGTSDGGGRWWHSAPLPGAAPGCCSSFSYQLDFTDARHGWLYGMLWEVQDSEVWQVAEQLWRTTDGGRIWTVVRAHLPLQGVTDNADETCPDEPAFSIAFAGQQDGWLTASSCSTIGSRPRVWRTSDGGATWTPTGLPTPGTGWPTANSLRTGVVVGSPRIIGSRLLVAVAGPRGLVIDASADGGRTWHVATPAVPGTGQYTSPGTFQAVSAGQWVVGTPGAMVRTADAGRTWRVVQTATALPGGPFWFTAPSRGYARLRTGAVAATSDGGRNWSAGAAPPTERPAAGLTVTGIQQPTPGTAIATGPDALRITRDGGRTWTPLGPVPGRHPLGPAEFPAPGTGFVTDHSGKLLWRTTNGGATWTALPQPAGVPGQARFWSPQIGIAAGLNGLYLTTSGGSTWQKLTLPGGYQLNGDAFAVPQRPAPPVSPGALCFAGDTGWAVASPRANIQRRAVLLSTDGGARWQPVLPDTILRTHGRSSLAVQLAGCQGSQAWVGVSRASYQPGGGASYDLLHTADNGQAWQDVLHLQSGPALPRLAVPLAGRALDTAPLPSGLVPAANPGTAVHSGITLTPEPMVTPSPSVAWLTLLAGNGGIGFAVTSDGGQHWQIHWFAAPRHDPRAAPPALSGLPAGLPWLATTATGARHAWVLLASTNGSGDSYLYATADGGATWRRVTTFG